MSTIAFTFNSVVLPDVRGIDELLNSAIDSLNPIGRDGLISNTGQLGGLAYTIRGQISGTDHDDLRTNWETLLAALYDPDGGNKIAALTSYNDRQINAQLVGRSFGHGVRDAGMITADYGLTFRSNDSYWEETGASSKARTNASTGDTMTITSGGDADEIELAPAWPIVTITTLATGLTADIVVTNTTTGAVFTFGAALGSNKVLVINMGARTITNDGVNAIDDVDHPSADWWMLRGGATNVIQLDFAGGAADVSWQLDWNKKYFNP